MARREEVARELWASMFRGNWLLFSANMALYLAQAILTLAFAYVLKQTFDAVAAGFSRPSRPDRPSGCPAAGG
ncbi:MAG: hypothetical protein LKE45_02440 [Olsenella sp.]|nr:hypothetical protein [Olsenella sp.]